MTIVHITYPSTAEVIATFVTVNVAPKGKTWLASQLGEYAAKHGIYIFHQGGTVLYVGKTDGASMSYGKRLRRHLHESAAQGRFTYPKFVQLSSRPICVSFIPSDQINSMVESPDALLDDSSKTAILEQVLIEAYEPTFQRGL